jgi:pimeloyl-ACP methyl ester carboxylesterase
MAAAFDSLPPLVTNADFARMLQLMMPLYWRHFEPERAAAVAERLILNVDAYLRCQELLQSYDVSGRLAEIETPTLVVVGDDDWICPPSQAERLRAGIPGATLVTIEKCGHFPWHEQPEEFFPAARDWIAAQSSGSPGRTSR